MPMIDLVAPGTGESLREECDHLVSSRDEKYPAVGGIPRFVPSEGYAESFGLEGRIHTETQLDSKTGTSIS